MDEEYIDAKTGYWLGYLRRHRIGWMPAIFVRVRWFLGLTDDEQVAWVRRSPSRGNELIADCTQHYNAYLKNVNVLQYVLAKVQDAREAALQVELPQKKVA